MSELFYPVPRSMVVDEIPLDTGLDIGVKPGPAVPVFAPEAGTVSVRGDRVRVTAESGRTWSLNSVTPDLQSGQPVRAGEPVGSTKVRFGLVLLPAGENQALLDGEALAALMKSASDPRLPAPAPAPAPAPKPGPVKDLVPAGPLVMQLVAIGGAVMVGVWGFQLARGKKLWWQKKRSR